MKVPQINFRPLEINDLKAPHVGNTLGQPLIDWLKENAHESCI